MDKIDYRKTNKYWNQGQEITTQYAPGYIIPAEFEDVAHYRFKKELCFLNKFGKFGGKYLEIGCGAGNFLYEWRDKFDLLIGIDFSKPLVATAKEKCKNFENIKICEDNALNFEKYLEQDDKFRFIFIGGCFMYLNDKDVSNLICGLCQKLENGGVLIFRESTVTKKRIYKKNITIRRTIGEYKELICLNKNNYTLSYYQNYSVNYTHFICLYLKFLPFLKNKINFFNNFLVEFFFLFLPVRLYTKIKKNMVLYHFFVITKKNQI